jgi:hypothetical protein
MTDAPPLAVRPSARPAGFRPAAIEGLPIGVTTAARALDVGGELRLWISGPAPGETAQLRYRLGTRIEPLSPLPPLPVVLAGAARCGDHLLVTGADPLGRPLALGVSVAAGSVSWRCRIEGTSPLAWPLPGCSPRPVVAWWEPAGTIEVVAIADGGLGERTTVPAGGPPLALSRGGSEFWAAWGHADGVSAVALGRAEPRTVHLRTASPAEVAVGSVERGLAIAWAGRDGAFLARFDDAGTPVRTPVPVDLAAAAGGTLQIVPGPEPVVWAQRGDAIEGEPAHWVSALVVPGADPLLVDGLVHDVASWGGEALAVVGSAELLLLERVRGKSA